MSDQQTPGAAEEDLVAVPGPGTGPDGAAAENSRTDDPTDPIGSANEGSPGDLDPSPVAVPHAGARYAVLRLSLLVTVGGVLYLLGVRGWVLLFVAVLASGLLSFFLFVRQREAAARNLEASLAAHNARRHARHDAPPGATAEPAGGADAP